MKTNATRLIICKLLMLFVLYSNAQTISDFESLTLPADSFWNGSDLTGGFSNGNAWFTNDYDTIYNYWSEGFVYSNMKDDTSAGYTNTYSAATAGGYGNSSNYCLGKEGAVIRLNNPAKGGIVHGMYITNSTYAATSMRDGDAFAKQFGDTTGTNSGLDQGDYPDWFKLSITGFYNGAAIGDTVHFYLADFRFADNSMDYIVTSWEWIDLKVLGNTDSLIFHLSSSDTGIWGMNTPGFFCMDNFTTADSPLSVENTAPAKSRIAVYPNPATGYINVSLPENINSINLSIKDLTGRTLLKENVSQNNMHHFNLNSYNPGIYIVEVHFAESSVERSIFIKQ